MPLRFSPPGGASALALKSLVRGAPGVDGDDGSLLFEQNSAPATDKPANSLWIDSDSTDLDVYQLVSSVWTDTGINLKGAPGTAATIAAGTTTTAAEGSSAAVANSGSSSAAVFDFTIPRGAAPAVGYTFSTTTTDSDPGNGIVRFNNATPASITTIYFDNQDADGNTVTTWLDTFDDSTDTSSKGFLTFTDVASPSTKIGFDVTGSSVTDGTGYRKVTVTHSFGTTLFTNAHRLAVTFSRTGNKGTDGAGTGDVTAAAANTADNRVVRTDGSSGKGIQESVINLDDTTGTLYPQTNDSGALGKAAQSWADLFLASGGVINWNNGTFTATQSGTTLAFSGALTATSYNGLTVTTSTGTLTITNGKTLSISNTLTLAGTDSTTMTFPSTSSTVITTGNTATITKGYSVTPYSQSWASNFTVDPSQGNYQYATNDAARTITAPASDCAVDILITNHASTAGSITFSGFTVGSSTGSTYATTGNNKYLLSIRRINSVATYSWYALQ